MMERWPVVAMVVVLGGCAVDPAQAYVDAALDPLNPRACRGITDFQLKGECVAMVAAEVAKHTGEVAPAEARCDQLPEGDPWRSECYFLVADTLALVGEDAKRLCLQSGDFASWCLGHALQREGRPLLDAAAAGTEGQVYRQVRERALFYFDDDKAAGQKLWHLVVEALASRDRHLPFSAATCGDVPEALCRSIYLTRLRFTQRDAGHQQDALVTTCRALPLAAADAAAHGVPSWTEDADPIVQAALRQFCDRSRPAQQRPPGPIIQPEAATMPVDPHGG